MAQQAPLIINGNDWSRGVSDSPHQGVAMLKLADIESYPGAIKAGKTNTNWFSYRASNTRTFTVVAATDVATSSGNMHATAGTNYLYTAVTLSSTGALPTGLSAGTVYFLIYITDTTFKFATTLTNAESGTAVDVTDTGSGTHTITPVPIGTIKHIVKHQGSGDMNGRLFAQDSNGRIWVGTASNVLLVLVPGNNISSASGNGLVIHAFSSTSATYLFAFNNSAIDVVNVHNASNVFGSPSWTNSWKTLNTASGTANSHHAIVGQDNIIYFADARYVGSIKEASGSTFDPATGATYIYNNQALDMPTGEVVNWLDELGTNLLIAGNTYNKIYPWNRTADSFDLPIIVPEWSIKKIRNIGNVIYILAGVKGNIYATQGTYVYLVRKLPDHLVNNGASLVASPVTWGGIAERNGALIFGVDGQTNANDGVWLLFPDGRLIQDSTAITGATSATAIYSEGEYYFFGYSGGAEYVTTTRYSNYETIFQSALYRIGDKTHKATYSTLEVQLATPAASGNIRVGYRADRTSAFTTISTFAADGASTSFKADAGIIDIENIQLQVELDGTVELVELRLLP